MEVPFFGLDRQYQRYRQEFLGITDRVLSTGSVLQGTDVQGFEQALSKLCHRKDAVAVGSCTDALAFALLAAGIEKGDEVIVTSFSFFASVSPILRVGAVPRFVDIDPDYYMMRPDLLEAQYTARTKAVLAVHLYGQMLPIKEIEDFTQRHNLVLIEDAAQALGSFHYNSPAGCTGKISCLSFDPTKVIGSFGSAGALLSDDPEIIECARSLRYHGRNPKTRHYEMLGYNSQLSTEMAAMLAFKVSRLPDWIHERNNIAAIYFDKLSDIKQIILPQIRQGNTHNWHKFVIRVQDRDALSTYLKQKGVTTMVHYPNALCDEPIIQQINLPQKATEVPTAREFSSSVISLPIFPELTGDEANYVTKCIRDFYNEDH